MIDRIFIPTVNRVNDQITLSNIPKSLIDRVTLVVQSWEIKKYKYDVDYLVLPKEINLDDRLCLSKSRKIIYEGVEIEDDVFLGPSMVFTNVINPRSFIVRKDEFKKTLLKKGSSIGANATIVCGVTIGEYALIGSGSVVNKDAKAFALVVGVPGKQIGWVSYSGNRLVFNEYDEAKDIYDNSYYKLVNNELKRLK